MTRKGSKKTPTWYEFDFDVPNGDLPEEEQLRKFLYEKHLEALRNIELVICPNTYTIYFFGTQVKLNKEQFNFLNYIVKQNGKFIENKSLLLETKKDNSNYVLSDNQQTILDDLADVKCSIKKAIKSEILQEQIAKIKEFEHQKKHKSRRIVRYKKRLKMTFKIYISIPVDDYVKWLTAYDKILYNPFIGKYMAFEFDDLFNKLIEFNKGTYISHYKRGREPLKRKIKNEIVTFCKENFAKLKIKSSYT